MPDEEHQEPEQQRNPQAPIEKQDGACEMGNATNRGNGGTPTNTKIQKLIGAISELTYWSSEQLVSPPHLTLIHHLTHHGNLNPLLNPSLHWMPSRQQYPIHPAECLKE